MWVTMAFLIVIIGIIAILAKPATITTAAGLATPGPVTVQVEKPDLYPRPTQWHSLSQFGPVGAFRCRKPYHWRWRQACALTLLAGCAQYENRRGVEVTWQAKVTSQLQPGQSSRKEVLALLGPPSQVISLEEETVLYYLFEKLSRATA